MTEKTKLEKVKIILRSLAVSSPSDNFTIDQLNRDYKKSEGQEIPYGALGHYSLKDFLRSIPDTLTLNLETNRVQPVITKENAHVYKFVTDTKSSQKMRKSRCNSSLNRPNNNIRQQNMNQQQRVWDTIPPLFSNQSYVNHQYNPQNYNRNQPLLQQSNNYSRPFEPGNLLAPPNSLHTNHRNPNIAMMNLMYQQNRNHLNILPLPTPLMYPSNACTSMITAEPTYKPKSRNISNGFTSSTSNRRSTLSNQKSKTDRKTADPISSNVDNQSEELNGHVDTPSEENEKEVDALPPIADDDPINLIGTECLGRSYGKSAPAALFPSELKAGDIHQIFITAVRNSFNFFFQFFEQQEIVVNLHNKLSSYDIESDNMIINISQINIGDMCAAFYCDKWLRAEILSEPDGDDEVMLCFIDFGTIVSKMPITNIRRILSDLQKIPRLCHRGVLANLEPTTNYRIDKTVTKTFCDMVLDKNMMALIADIEDDDTIVMTVIDTSLPDEDVSINEVLMHRLLAAKGRKCIS